MKRNRFAKLTLYSQMERRKMMARVFYLCLCMALLLAGCKKENKSEYTRFHEDGRAKPVVAVAHVIDSSNFDVNWSLSDEFTKLVLNRISYQGKMFIPDFRQPDLASNENPFGSDLSWVKNHFQDTEFVVFLELIQHENTPVSAKQASSLSPHQDTSTHLNMAFRVRVVDVRDTPEVVLQEMIRDTYYISKNMIPIDYRITTWGTDEYATSPLGMAHTQIVKEIVERAQTYILLAKSK